MYSYKVNAFKLNKSDYKIIVGYLVFATIWLIFKFYVQKYKLVEYFIDIPVFWLKVLLLLYVSKVLLINFLVKKKKYVILIILTLSSFWLIGFLTFLSGELSRDGFINWKELMPFGQLFIMNFHSSLGDLSFPLALISAKKYYEYQLRTTTFSNIQKELELRLLRSQFNPHFLYNSLNTIDALIDYSPKEKVKEYIINLASLYQNLIKTNEDDIVTLEDEMVLAKNYIYLIETRFENDYTFHVAEKGPIKGVYLPSGVLLSALENVVKHNEPQNNVSIVTTIAIDHKTVTITNTISNPKVVNESLGTGLQSLKKRYELLSDKMIEINSSAMHFILVLPLLKVVN
ncbi:histidine kinase [Aquimarina sp. ERC-38]|uniref:sensor histidine kinase n=1 Tax=Aquimarina sp. ERC-38 TaxID=2949996 RepID=UPI002247C0F7|nr:sensor histidine kinase [Aquimarina sp. ERC-38]UZO80137.1 histidine kinase [Aquimarina sp. ERC-38]